MATVGVYDGASGLSLVSVGSFGISDEGVLCRPLHRWHLPDNRQLRPMWHLCRQLKRLLVLSVCCYWLLRYSVLMGVLVDCSYRSYKALHLESEACSLATSSSSKALCRLFMSISDQKMRSLHTLLLQFC